jgi:hypothetical protein
MDDTKSNVCVRHFVRAGRGRRGPGDVSVVSMHLNRPTRCARIGRNLVSEVSDE